MTVKILETWVEETAKLTKPDRVVWCTGSKAEYQELMQEMCRSDMMHELNSETYPNCFLHRSAANDVARTEHLTFICRDSKESVGPNNNWMSIKEGHEKADKLFAGAMQGRTMYVIPYCMGPLGSEMSRYGVEITDSPYVVVNMHLMTRCGDPALAKIEEGKPFVKGLHSTGDLSLENRLILHFPDELAIKSIGSGYGGNALLGKKCHALRIASSQGEKEGWLAEHMLIVGIENPLGERTYVAAAFPSACGKTNLAMLIPPETYPGWKVFTVGDDIAWMHIKDGQLYAINPEAGYFGVAPGTSDKTNPNALEMLQQDAIFTNVGLTENNEPWWEGKDQVKPVTDWHGNPYRKEVGPAAHPNSRFTVRAKQCPSYAKEAEDPNGVPISAIIFGGRRPSLIPLVYQAKNWAHGVLMGAAVSSQTTAAAIGEVGVLRHDPMAMKPFCGYNFADYWQHWLNMGDRLTNKPNIFHVNWFRKDDDGNFMWPGFGENIRVLEWMIKRTKDQGYGVKTPIGIIPAHGAINTEGLDITDSEMEELCDVKPDGWKEELEELGTYLKQYGDRLPQQLQDELQEIKRQLNH